MANERPTQGGSAYPVTIIGSESSGSSVSVVDSSWTLSLQAEESSNDSDKTFTVPAGQEWQVLSLWVEYASTGTAGNRQIEVRVLDSSDDVIFVFRVGVTQAASLTYYYLLAPGMADMTSVRSSAYLTSPLPPSLFIPSGYKLNVRDSAAVDAAADDMVVQLLVAYRNV